MKKLVAIATLVAMLLLVGCAQGQASTSADSSSRSAASASVSSSTAESTDAAVEQSATTAVDDSTESEAARVPLQSTYKQSRSRWTCIHTAGSSRLARFRGPSQKATSRSQPRQGTSCCTRATKSQSSRARTAGLILHSVISKAQLPIRCVKCSATMLLR